MRIWSEELNKLSLEIDPWWGENGLRPDAPESIRKKYKRFVELWEKEKEKQIDLCFK